MSLWITFDVVLNGLKRGYLTANLAERESLMFVYVWQLSLHPHVFSVSVGAFKKKIQH